MTDPGFLHASLIAATGIPTHELAAAVEAASAAIDRYCENTTIRPGQVYRSCDPRGGFSIRVVSWQPGAAKAWVVDAITGKRARWILTSALHATPTTRDGKPRRTGYALEQQ